MKTIKEIVAHIAKLEGKKSEVSIGNLREVVGIISDLISRDPDALLALVNNGKRRAKKKKK